MSGKIVISTLNQALLCGSCPCSKQDCCADVLPSSLTVTISGATNCPIINSSYVIHYYPNGAYPSSAVFLPSESSFSGYYGAFPLSFSCAAPNNTVLGFLYIYFYCVPGSSLGRAVGEWRFYIAFRLSATDFFICAHGICFNGAAQVVSVTCVPLAASFTYTYGQHIVCCYCPNCFSTTTTSTMSVSIVP